MLIGTEVCVDLVNVLTSNKFHVVKMPRRVHTNIFLITEGSKIEQKLHIDMIDRVAMPLSQEFSTDKIAKVCYASGVIF